MLTYPGVVQNGVIVLDNGVVLPDGAKVLIDVLSQNGSPDASSKPVDESRDPAAASEKSVWQKMIDVAKEHENRPTKLPADLAENHDHYLHGAPKRS